jgi:hypothetical protein
MLLPYNRCSFQLCDWSKVADPSSLTPFHRVWKRSWDDFCSVWVAFYPEQTKQTIPRLAGSLLPNCRISVLYHWKIWVRKYIYQTWLIILFFLQWYHLSTIGPQASFTFKFILHTKSYAGSISVSEYTVFINSL